ncbi:hypothetical protein OIO90_001953 [Microbotryomycetes sp. JL221]|nr:hypothetical protein OIO90_001953 [Microbotryomycetes sp. JL221]
MDSEASINRTLFPMSPPLSDVDLPGVVRDWWTRSGSSSNKQPSPFTRERRGPLSPPESPPVTHSRRKHGSGIPKSSASSTTTSPKASRKPPTRSIEPTTLGARNQDGSEAKAPRDDTVGAATRARELPDSPILPKVRLSLPTHLTDEEDWPPRVSTSAKPSSSRRVSYATEAKGKVVTSAETTTTTTTARKTTEKRIYRRSRLPASLDIPHDDTGDLYSRSSSPRSVRHNLARPSLSSSSRARSGSSSSIASTSLLSDNHARRRRKDSSTHGSGIPVRASKPSLLSPKAALSLPQFDPQALGQALSASSHHLLKPFITAFAVLFISTLACCSVFAVLASSYSLSMYDDCYQRFGDLQRGIGSGRKRIKGSIQGVRQGMGKMMGSATRALDLVVWVSGAKRIYIARGIISEDERTSGDANARDDDSYTDSSLSDDGRGAPHDRPRNHSQSRPPLRRGRSSRVKSVPTSSRPTPERLFDESQDDRRGPDGAETWTDDEQPPFDVPPTTPFTSRPGSRRNSPSRGPTLPPRPPMRVLLPSIIFASLFVALKLIRLLWTRQPSGFWREFARDRKQPPVR